jgi:hypothetical protein
LPVKTNQHSLGKHIYTSIIVEIMPIFPDCYDEWGLYKITYDGDHKMYDMLYEGTEDQCRQYAYENYTDKEQGDMCLMDWEAREWDV